MTDARTPRAGLRDRLDDAASERLAAMTGEIAADPARVRVHHPAAARRVGRGPLDAADPDGLLGPTLDDAVRAELLHGLRSALHDDPPALVAEVSDLYRYGDADEKRAVLRALPLLAPGPEYLSLVTDALRANDVRLVAAAMGDYAAAHLDVEAWRHGVLKCLFVGVPLSAVAGLPGRGDRTLARMVAGFCHERVAAGRDVPADVWQVLGEHADVLDETVLRDELASPYPDRRAAAERFLAGPHTPAPTATRGTQEA